MQRFHRESVAAALASCGSRDPDVLHAHKRALLSAAREPWWIGTGLTWAGGICTLTVVLAPIGLPLLFAGLRLRRRGAASLAGVEAGFADFVAAAGRPRPAAGSGSARTPIPSHASSPKNPSERSTRWPSS
ncbi:MAG: hypothetical protein RRA92_11160 [Gemmatimonadota bacterium]|nr:hypothetical protein [Gemmatimonadota bacterium]